MLAKKLMPRTRFLAVTALASKIQMSANPFMLATKIVFTQLCAMMELAFPMNTNALRERSDARANKSSAR
jgi:hypothetical protein